MSRLEWIFSNLPISENLCIEIAAILRLTTGEPLIQDRIAMLPLAKNGALLLKQNETIVGSLLWMKTNHSTARILGFGVHPELQGRGYGTDCWKILKTELLKQKIVQITLEVRESNTNAINFYRSRGLIPKGWIENYYREERGVLMEQIIKIENS